MSITLGTIFHTLKRDGVLKPGRALDLGCGEGKDAAAFAENNFIVDAVDADESAVKSIISSTAITPIISKIEDFVISENTYQLVSCQLVLHFLPKHVAENVIERMIKGAVQGGVISFNLLGENDEWKNKWSTWTRKEVDEFVSKQSVAVHKIVTNEGKGLTRAGTMKYWHILNYVLIKN